MKKLFRLKDWFMLEEAADHLSSTAGELVTPADILRLAMDLHAELGVNLLRDAQAFVWEEVELAEADKRQLGSTDQTGISCFEDYRTRVWEDLDQGTYYYETREAVSVKSGAYDLLLSASEAEEVRYAYHALNGKANEDEWDFPAGGLLLRTEEGVVELLDTVLQTERGPLPIPASRLPSGTYFILRRPQLLALEKKLHTPDA